MQNNLTVNLKQSEEIYQMHDEIIDEIYVEKDSAVIKFNELHFIHNDSFKNCKISVSDPDDIYSAAYIDIFKMKKCFIKCGKRFYLEEFINYMKLKKITLEVIDIVRGYEKFIIFGKLKKSTKYGDAFTFTFNVKEVEYQFY